MRTILPPQARLVPPNAKLVFKGKIFDVYQWEQELYDGTSATFEMLKRPDTVEVLAIRDGKLVILHEQQPTMKPFYGLPGGRHDVASETELQAAQRELLEETGLSFETWKLIEVSQPYTKIEWFVYLFVATDLISQVQPHPDAGEKIEIELVDYSRIMKLGTSDRGRFLPKQILEQVSSIDELSRLREISISAVARAS